MFTNCSCLLTFVAAYMNGVFGQRPWASVLPCSKANWRVIIMWAKQQQPLRALVVDGMGP